MNIYIDMKNQVSTQNQSKLYKTVKFPKSLT